MAIRARVRNKVGWLRASKRERRHGLVGQRALWRVKREFQIDFLRRQGLKSEHYLADIGCGTLRGGIPLIEYLAQGHYFGIERDPKVLKEGKRELADAGLDHKRPTLLATDELRSLDLRPFDFIWAFSVLIHMTDDIVDGCLAFTARHGPLYANVLIGESQDAAWRKYPVVWRPLEFYEAAAERHGLQVDDIGTLASLGHPAGVDGDDQRMLRFR